jgi:hypothetical protein
VLLHIHKLKALTSLARFNCFKIIVLDGLLKRNNGR